MNFSIDDVEGTLIVKLYPSLKAWIEDDGSAWALLRDRLAERHAGQQFILAFARGQHDRLAHLAIVYAQIAWLRSSLGIPQCAIPTPVVFPRPEHCLYTASVTGSVVAPFATEEDALEYVQKHSDCQHDQ